MLARVLFVPSLLLCSSLVDTSYQPPCNSSEELASLPIPRRSVCTTKCSTDEDCPKDTSGAFSVPKCLLEAKLNPDTTAKPQRYCTLPCYADSYCAKGSKCTKVPCGSMKAEKENPLNTVDPVLLHDGVPGVCSYQLKKKTKVKIVPLTFRQLALHVMRANRIMVTPGLVPLDEL